MNYQVKHIVVGNLQTNCYVVINEKKEALLIDPGDEADKIIEFVRPYTVVGILVTHFHADHVGALSKLENFYSLKANQKVSSFFYKVFDTKGHTNDSISFYFPSISSVFVGDFLFYHGIGRTDLGGNSKDVKKSLQVFFGIFSDDTIIYPGHGPLTIFKEERNYLQYYEKTL